LGRGRAFDSGSKLPAFQTLARNSSAPSAGEPGTPRRLSRFNITLSPRRNFLLTRDKPKNTIAP
jgi:hypothetical protein